MTGKPPSARSATTEKLDDVARRQAFELQVCHECGAVQYPCRDVCFNCLSSDLVWRGVAATGTLLARTVVRHSAEPYFQALAPFCTGLVALDCGPTVLCFVEMNDQAGQRVKLRLALDDAGRGIFRARRLEDR